MLPGEPPLNRKVPRRRLQNRPWSRPMNQLPRRRLMPQIRPVLPTRRPSKLLLGLQRLPSSRRTRPPLAPPTKRLSTLPSRPAVKLQSPRCSSKHLPPPQWSSRLLASASPRRPSTSRRRPNWQKRPGSRRRSRCRSRRRRRQPLGRPLWTRPMRHRCRRAARGRPDASLSTPPSSRTSRSKTAATFPLASPPRRCGWSGTRVRTRGCLATSSWSAPKAPRTSASARTCTFPSTPLCCPASSTSCA
mmetsp:Transcript_5325/g.9223  ORF Transcript_5325/g.9223 Transcript_5325/m.9223 type:complete len:246 (-) Transcript_5325:284-1021(-)